MISKTQEPRKRIRWTHLLANMLHLLTVLTPDPKRNIDIYRLIIIINPGYHPADTVIIPIHL